MSGYTAYGEEAQPALYVNPPPGVLDLLIAAAEHVDRGFTVTPPDDAGAAGQSRDAAVRGSAGYALPPSDNLGRIAGAASIPPSADLLGRAGSTAMAGTATPAGLVRKKARLQHNVAFTQ